jgi:hypothetical protein
MKDLDVTPHKEQCMRDYPLLITRAFFLEHPDHKEYGSTRLPLEFVEFSSRKERALSDEKIRTAKWIVALLFRFLTCTEKDFMRMLYAPPSVFYTREGRKELTMSTRFWFNFVLAIQHLSMIDWVAYGKHINVSWGLFNIILYFVRSNRAVAAASSSDQLDIQQRLEVLLFRSMLNIVSATPCEDDMSHVTGYISKNGLLVHMLKYSDPVVAKAIAWDIFELGIVFGHPTFVYVFRCELEPACGGPDQLREIILPHLTTSSLPFQSLSRELFDYLRTIVPLTYIEQSYRADCPINVQDPYHVFAFLPRMYRYFGFRHAQKAITDCLGCDSIKHLNPTSSLRSALFLWVMMVRCRRLRHTDTSYMAALTLNAANFILSDLVVTVHSSNMHMPPPSAGPVIEHGRTKQSVYEAAFATLYLQMLITRTGELLADIIRANNDIPPQFGIDLLRDVIQYVPLSMTGSFGKETLLNTMKRKYE